MLVDDGCRMQHEQGVCWRQLSAVLMALTSVAAATVWLGYVPAALLEAAAQQLAAADPSVLRSAGLQAAAEAVAQQAAMAYGEPEEEEKKQTKDAEPQAEKGWEGGREEDRIGLEGEGRYHGRHEYGDDVDGDV